jgi:hypothetical protein
MRTRLGCTVAAGALLLGAAAACGSDEPDSADPVPTTAPPTTAAPAPETTTTLDPSDGLTDDQRAVVEVVRASWAAALAALDPPDPDHPKLVEVLAGEELASIRKLITNLRDQGQYARRPDDGPYEVHIGDPLIEGDKAVVYDCLIDDAARYRSSGEPVEGSVLAILFSTTVERQSGGQWMVIKRENRGSSEELSFCRGEQP